MTEHEVKFEANLEGLVHLLLRRGYYPVTEECAGKGAQQIDGKWFMPRWGSDTLRRVVHSHGDEIVS